MSKPPSATFAIVSHESKAKDFGSAGVFPHELTAKTTATAIAQIVITNVERPILFVIIISLVIVMD
ncbi:MAG: hypothetical protein Q4F54_00085 [Coriobacteriia bacterium]|nr:hypothetical protein [Coriobacteriia bacterium]